MIEIIKMKKGVHLMAKITNEIILQAIKELADQLKNHTEETNKRFEQIDHCFEQIDQRFEQTKQQLTEINERFDQVEQKIEQMDKQLTDVANGQKILVEELFDNKKEIKRVKNVLNMY
jgi:type IV secretion system protein TrbJ